MIMILESVVPSLEFWPHLREEYSYFVRIMVVLFLIEVPAYITFIILMCTTLVISVYFRLAPECSLPHLSFVARSIGPGFRVGSALSVVTPSTASLLEAVSGGGV